MSTSGSFNPPEIPCDETIYTATALRALRDAGSLRINCHYRVQSDPIGTSGNTSTTVVELHATANNHLSMEGKLQTSFYTDAWHCIFDLDLGTNGSFQEVTDNWNNTVRDPDPDSGVNTIVNQFPWHRGSDSLRDNTIDDCLLPGWDTFVGELRDNHLQEATVDLTGVTSPGPAPASFFRRNIVNSGSVTLHVPTVYVNNNTLNNSTVSHLGTGAGSFSLQNNTVLDATVEVDAATISSVTANENVIGGAYRLSFQGKTGGPAIFTGNRCFSGAGNPTAEATLGGSATNLSVLNNDFHAGVITLTAAANATLSGCDTISQTITHTGGGTMTLTRLKGYGATVSHLGNGALSSSDLTMSGNAQVRTLAGQSGTISLSTSDLKRAYTIQVEATSTASLTVSGSTLRGHNSAGTALDLQVDGSGTRSILDSTVTAASNQTGLVLVGGGPASIGNSNIQGGRVIRDPATTAQMILSQCRATGTVQQGAAATVGTLNVFATTFDSVALNLNQQGPGAMTINGCKVQGLIQNSAAATRGLSVTSSTLVGGTLSQNRTGGTGADTVNYLEVTGSTVTLAGAVDPGANQTPVNVVSVTDGSSLTLTDPVGSGVGLVVLQRSNLSSNATVTGTGTGLVSSCRFGAGVTVNLGAFSHDRCIAEGSMTVTPTANNTGALANKSFNDWS